LELPALSNPNSVLIDIAEMSEMLNRSVRSLFADKAVGRLPKPIQLGNSIRWRRHEILRWIDAGCPEAAVWERLEGQNAPTSSN
jgi:predicted DNA-binding transcriptional regulator AlpA